MLLAPVRQNRGPRSIAATRRSVRTAGAGGRGEAPPPPAGGPPPSPPPALPRRAPAPDASGLVSGIDPASAGWDWTTFHAYQLMPGQPAHRPADDMERLGLVLEG